MILKLPQKGILRSVTAHRSDLSIFTDWLEASCLFIGEKVDGSKVVDILLENNVYKSQDFAWAFFHKATSLMENRARYLGTGYPFSVNNDVIRFGQNWEDYLPYSFCLFLSLSAGYPKWKKSILVDGYNTQGSLFELFSSESIQHIFGGWVVKNTGWSRTRIVSLNRVVRDVSVWLNEQMGEVARWSSAKAKEAGLDLISYRPFADANVGAPVFMWQCASGEKWKEKRKTPDMALWRHLIAWAVEPRKGMTIPFALDEESVRQSSAIVEGVLLDRHRLLEPGLRNANWLTDPLSNQIINWMTPLVAQLPTLEDNPI